MNTKRKAIIVLLILLALVGSVVYISLTIPPTENSNDLDENDYHISPFLTSLQTKQKEKKRTWK